MSESTWVLKVGCSVSGYALSTYQNKKRERKKERQAKKERKGESTEKKECDYSHFFLLFPACSVPFRIFSKATLVIRLFNKRVITFAKDSFSRNTVGPKEARSQGQLAPLLSQLQLSRVRHPSLLFFGPVL